MEVWKKVEGFKNYEVSNYGRIKNFKNNLQSKTNNKIVLDTLTGVYYESVLEASRYYNYKKSSLASKLNGTRNNNTNLIYA